MARPVGRPRALESPEQAWELGMKYFEECDANHEPYLITGLALALGLPARQSLCEYQLRPEYTDTIKRLKQIVESGLEKKALSANNPAGAIFIMKNMGWSDRQDLALSTPNGPLQTDSKIEIVIVSANSTSEKQSS